jgi:hypothetical protein
MEVGAGVSRCPVLPEKCCHARRPSSRYFYASKDGSLTSPHLVRARIPKKKKKKTILARAEQRHLKCTLLLYLGEAGNGFRITEVGAGVSRCPVLPEKRVMIVGR